MVSSVVTFVMVFVIQSNQNRGSRPANQDRRCRQDLGLRCERAGVEDSGHLLTRLAARKEDTEREIDSRAGAGTPSAAAIAEAYSAGQRDTTERFAAKPAEQTHPAER
jgi:hypothetical protein